MPTFCLLWLGLWGKGFGNSSCTGGGGSVGTEGWAQ